MQPLFLTLFIWKNDNFAFVLNEKPAIEKPAINSLEKLPFSCKMHDIIFAIST